jgi:PAS domain S-box-containing protein
MDPKIIKVLLLDDDPNLRAVLSSILKEKGFDAVPVNTGAAALARIGQQDIDVALVDLKLEDMSGLDVLRGIKARSPDTECIFLTGHASQTTAIEAVNLGAFSYFQKPYQVDQLLIAIRRAAEKHTDGQAIQESEARFRSMIENSTDLICILNPDGSLRYTSPSIHRLLGYSPEDIVPGTSLQDYIHPGEIASFIENLQQLINSHESAPISMLLRIRHKDGSWRTLEGTGSNLLENPTVSGIIVNARDVTERRRADAEHQAILEIMYGLASTKNLPEFLELIHHSIAKVLDAENFFVVLHNKNSGLFEEVFAVDEFDAIMPPSKLEKSITSYVFRTGEPLMLNREIFKKLAALGEVELVGTDSLSWLGAPLKTPLETIGVMVVQNYDLADRYSDHDREFLSSVGVQVALAVERKQAEDALRSSESSLHAVLQSAADGILAVGSENEVLYFNERFSEMWQIPISVMDTKEDAVLLQHVLDQLVDPQVFLDKVRELYKSDETSFDTLFFKDGRVFERLSHPLIQGSDLRGRVWSFRDITTRRQSEEDLQRSQQATVHANRLLLALSQGAQAVQRARTTKEAYTAIQDQLSLLGYHTTGFELSENKLSLHIIYLNYKENLVHKAEKATGLLLRDFQFTWKTDGAIQRVLVGNETVFVEDPAQAVAEVLPKKLHRLSPFISELFKLNQSIFTPLKVGEEIIGILAVTGPDLSASDNPVIATFANQVAIAIQNIRFYEQAQWEISERMQVEKALTASETELRALFASMQDVVLVIDRNGVYREIAPTNPDLLVKPPHELLGNKLQDVFPLEKAHSFLKMMLQVLVTKQTAHVEYDLMIGDRMVWFETSISYLTEDSTLWVAHDITERKFSERQVRQRNDDLSLMNAINAAVNRGENLPAIIHLLSEQVKVIFNSYGATVHLLSVDRTRLVLQNLTLPMEILAEIEKKLGITIPVIEHDLSGAHPFQQVIETRQSELIKDQKIIKAHIATYADALPMGGKVIARIKKSAPSLVVRMMGLRSQIIVPLLSGPELVGTLTVGSRELFTSSDLQRLEAIAGQLTAAIQRLQAEGAVSQAEARYRSVVEQVPAIFYTETMDQRVIYISPRVETILGYTQEEWMSAPDFWKKLVHPDDLEKVQLEDDATNRSGETFEVEYRSLTKDGRMVWLRDQAMLVKDEGKTLFWQGVMYDISAMKESDIALRASEERYRMLAENMTDTVWLMDLGLTTTYLSPSVTRLRGYTLEEINKIPLDRQLTPDSLQRFLQLFSETLSTENISHPERRISRTLELEFIKKDGTKFWSENTFTLIRNPQGDPFAILGSGRDISERKKAQATLQASEQYYRALIENNSDAVVIVDPRGMILYESPAYARIMGRSGVQRRGRNGFEFIHPEERGTVAQMLNDLVQHAGEIRHTSFRNQHKDGTWRWIEATGANLLADSAVHGLVLNLHDITERKLAEEEIRRRVADLEVLYENGLSISVLLEPGQIAQKMIEILTQKLEWHLAAIRLVNPDSGRLELTALEKFGLGPEKTRDEMDRMDRVFASPNQGLSGWVIQHGKTVRCGDVLMEKRYLPTFPEIRSGLYVPMMIGERSIGSISVESRQLNRFSAEDERLLQTLAAQSAIAIENARLYQAALSAEKRKTALHDGGLEIVRAGQDIEKLCLALHHAAKQVMLAEVFTVCLLTEDGLNVDAPYLYDRGTRNPNTRLPAGAGITGRVIKSKKSLRIIDAQKSRGVKPIMVEGAEPTRAILMVPLLAQEKIIGVISAQSRKTGVYTPEDQTFMETLASEAAVAFENARLFEEIRRRLAELEALSQVSVSLTSAIDLQPLLENILAGAINAIPAAEKGTIFLTEPDGLLRLQAMSGYLDPRLTGMVLPDQKGYAARVARDRIPLRVDDARSDYEVPYKGMIEEIDAVLSGIAAPLIVKKRLIGVICLDNTSRISAFSESDLHMLVTFASSAAIAIENARLFTETQQRMHRLSALHSIDAAIGASVDTNVTLNIVLEHVMTELKADAAAVLLFNQHTMMLEYTAGSGFRIHSIEGLRLRLGEGLAGQSVLQRRAINITDLRQANEMQQLVVPPNSSSASAALQYLEGENFVSYHAMPLIAKGQVQGVLEIFRRTPMQVDQEWITFFEMLAGQTALAIDNGRLFEDLQHSNLDLTLAYDATIQGWSQALELRDEETEGHTRRVTDLTLRLIQTMGLEDGEIEHARRGALLHDIGKIAVPDSILLKPGPLDEREWNVMRQHPQYAHNLLSPISYLAPAIHIPWCHHEKWDGSGYPRGLKGDQIPMVARIFSIVDVYDALTSNRPYRQAWPREKAMDYILEESGMHFDPQVVKAFMDLMAGEK